MKPLIFEFAETPPKQNMDFSLIEYSNKLNLSVLKGTEVIAVTSSHMSTETFTKVNQEPTDSDNDLRHPAKLLLNTETETRTAQEPTDSDCNGTHKVRFLLDTRTDTFTIQEASDNDKDKISLMRLMDTQTITETQEPTDSDK